MQNYMNMFHMRLIYNLLRNDSVIYNFILDCIIISLSDNNYPIAERM